MKKIITLLLTSFLYCCFSCTAAPVETAQNPEVIISDENPVPDPALYSTLFKGQFPIGVWLQNPVRMRDMKLGDGKQTNAANYKKLGVNLFVGLWGFPDDDGMYPGYSIDAATELKKEGLLVIAGDSVMSEWPSGFTDFSDIFIGYLVGDEPDMKGVTPDEWKKKAAILRAKDPDRLIYGNLGKGAAFDRWPGYKVVDGSSYEVDMQTYTSALDVASSDYYGITDPWEPLSNHGVWTYGKAISNVKKRSTSNLPVWGYLEVSAEATLVNSNQIIERMPPELVLPAAWNMIIHGASGIIYFCHQFLGGMIEDGCLNDPGIPAAMLETNKTIKTFESILTGGKDIPGTTVDNVEDVPDMAMRTIRFGKDAYLFTMVDGDSTRIYSGTRDKAVFHVFGEAGNTPVDILDVNGNSTGTTTMIDGTISQTNFKPYEIRIFKFSYNSTTTFVPWDGMFNGQKISEKVDFSESDMPEGWSIADPDNAMSLTSGTLILDLTHPVTQKTILTRSTPDNLKVASGGFKVTTIDALKISNSWDSQTINLISFINASYGPIGYINDVKVADAASGVHTFSCIEYNTRTKDTLDAKNSYEYWLTFKFVQNKPLQVRIYDYATHEFIKELKTPENMPDYPLTAISFGLGPNGKSTGYPIQSIVENIVLDYTGNTYPILGW